MSARPGLGVRLAHWWVAAYTMTAPAAAAVDRRREIAADLFDELADGADHGLSGRQVSRRIAGRVLRGVGADLLWRCEGEWTPGRLTWHLRHPGTVLLTGSTLLLPVALLADVARGDPAYAGGTILILSGLVQLLSTVVVCFGVFSTATRLPELGRPAWSRQRLARAARGLAAFLYALAALWRFAPEPFSWVSTGAWAGSGVWAVIATLAAIPIRRRKTAIARL
jgi:hypothetical protein